MLHLVSCFTSSDLNIIPFLLLQRVPPAWGVMKHLNKKIPETASKKAQMYGYFFEQDKYDF